MSKGDKPRPMNVTYDEYVDNWEKAFGKKDKYETVTVEIEGETPLMDNSDAMDKMIGDYIEAVSDKKEKMPQIKNDVELRNDNSLEVEIERMKTNHA